MAKRYAIGIALLCLVLLSGVIASCDALGWTVWWLAPRKVENIKAEYPGLPKTTVAVLYYMDECTLYEYPEVRLTLGARVAEQLRNNIEDVRVIDPAAVVRYQNENLNWETTPKTELAEALSADHVLWVSLIEFSTYQPGQLNAYQGRIVASAKLYDAQRPPEENPVWESEENFSITFPQNVSYQAQNEPLIRADIEAMFADMLAKRFYDHKVKQEEE